MLVRSQCLKRPIGLLTAVGVFFAAAFNAPFVDVYSSVVFVFFLSCNVVFTQKCPTRARAREGEEGVFFLFVRNYYTKEETILIRKYIWTPDVRMRWGEARVCKGNFLFTHRSGQQRRFPLTSFVVVVVPSGLKCLLHRITSHDGIGQRNPGTIT